MARIADTGAEGEKMAREDIGGKAYALHIMRQEGIAIPAFSTIPHTALDALFRKLQWDEGIAALPFAQAQRRIDDCRRRLATLDLTPFVDRHILPLTGTLHADNVIIRSSATGEDGEAHSFAGIFASAQAGKDPASLTAAVRTVLDGWLAERVLFYLNAKGIPRWPRLSLIVQEYVAGEVSGVMFTASIEDGQRGTIINAAKGAAKAVVEGKDSAHLFIPRDATAARATILSRKRLDALLREGERITELFGCPQDIEWTFQRGTLCILQARPITAREEHIRVWDNSNIAENYSGIVLPLTASFCSEMYRAVYIDVARTSGVSAKRIREHDPIFSHLLGFFQGRIYYNMLNWYTMLTLFPGYERNKRNLDRMISARSKAELDREHAQNVTTGFKIRYYARNTYRFLRFQGSMRRFHDDMRGEFARLSSIPVTGLSEHDLLARYYRLKRDVLSRWSITVDNDFLLMTFFGALRGRCDVAGIPENTILSRISGIGGVVSAEQVERITRISSLLHRHPALVREARRDPGKCYASIMAGPAHKPLRDALQAYETEYGGRFASELRLEEESSGPEEIIEVLLRYAPKTRGASRSRARPAKSHDDQFPITTPILRFLAARVRYHAKQRETSRLLRAQAFDHARKIFAELGVRFARAGALGHARDIFYLQVTEIEQYLEGSSAAPDLGAIVQARKSAYASYTRSEMPCVIVTEGLPYRSYRPRIDVKTAGSKRLRGKGCSGGRITGKVRIMMTYDLAAIGEDDIIVAKHTDPGWTPIMGLCKGIIVEQGGVLSHAAIISRELGIPCVVQVAGVTKRLKDGQRVTMDGRTGEIIIA
jgi:pyruvate,water dikinase